MIEKLKTKTISFLTQRYKSDLLKMLKSILMKKIKDGINKLVDQKLKEHNVQQGNGDIKKHKSF